MKEYAKEELEKILMEQGYPKNQNLLDSVTSQILSMEDESKAMLEEWLLNKKQASFEVNGITAAFMREKCKSKEIAVILTYDHLIKEQKDGKREFADLLRRGIM